MTKFLWWYLIFWSIEASARYAMIHAMSYERYQSEYSAGVRIFAELVRWAIFVGLWRWYIA